MLVLIMVRNFHMTFNAHIKSHYVCQCFQELSRETNIHTRTWSNAVFLYLRKQINYDCVVYGYSFNTLHTIINNFQLHYEEVTKCTTETTLGTGMTSMFKLYSIYYRNEYASSSVSDVNRYVLVRKVLDSVSGINMLAGYSLTSSPTHARANFLP
jgi:hypothetical protein